METTNSKSNDMPNKPNIFLTVSKELKGKWVAEARKLGLKLETYIINKMEGKI